MTILVGTPHEYCHCPVKISALNTGQMFYYFFFPLSFQGGRWKWWRFSSHRKITHTLVRWKKKSSWFHFQKPSNATPHQEVVCLLQNHLLKFGLRLNSSKPHNTRSGTQYQKNRQDSSLRLISSLPLLKEQLQEWLKSPDADKTSSLLLLYQLHQYNLKG